LQRLQEFVKAEDQRFEQAMAAEDPATVQKVKESIVTIAEQDYGVSRQELAQLWRTQPLMHTAAFQRMMVDATRFRLAQREVANKVDRSALPVQRPGTAGQARSSSEYSVDAAMARFKADPTPKTAADLLMAKRAAR